MRLELFSNLCVLRKMPGKAKLPSNSTNPIELFCYVLRRFFVRHPVIQTDGDCVAYISDSAVQFCRAGKALPACDHKAEYGWNLILPFSQRVADRRKEARNHVFLSVDAGLT